MEDHVIGSVDAWLTCRRLLCRRESVGRNDWLTKDGGYLILDNRILRHKIKKLIDKEVGKPQNNVTELYEENGVYNFYVEIKLAESEAEVSHERWKLARKQSSSVARRWSISCRRVKRC